MNIFITGAAGFLGSRFVRRLLDEGHHLFLLARTKSKMDKLIDSLSLREQEQVTVLEGDLTQDGLGLSEQSRHDIDGNIDVVYHSAAYLSFDDRDREKLFHVNVEGTRRLLAFAKEISVNTFIHVSTAYTLGDRRVGREALYSPEDTTFVNAYEESKCHAEQLVMSYQDDFRVMVMRPAIVVGDSKTGEADTTFGLYGVMRTIELLKKRYSRAKGAERERIEAGMKILVEKDETTQVVPVDYVTQVLACVLNYGEAGKIYHIANPNPPTNDQLNNVIRESFDFPYVELVSYENVGNLTEEEIRLNQPLQVFQSYMNRSITFEDENTQEMLAKAGEEPVSMDEAMLHRIVNAYRDRKNTSNSI
ncbi:SDR family NAD(P)-dependent oxidoreductase [Texcoconibacillus texcoconensis]|uniref:Nucleoside-diphosphate-sugar epimerase n=1 Tax=Texcoconibacillus texcoconensis TaxID=1095777 RepID=A0A840QMB0_9BACI|nr:SDR family oxidoreductase [Texcoconibacillus texcoconensis]MBB5172496.1 nucleoside-diphosphate-sugar epimerase [Texcoconibacillus texcoconensis]